MLILRSPASGAMSDTMVQTTPAEPEPRELPGENPWGKQPEQERLEGTAGLRRRKKRRVKGFHIDSDSDAYPAESSSCSDEESDSLPTPQDEYFPPLPIYEGCEEGEVVISPSVLPRYADQMSVVSVEASLSFAEACIDRFAPYHELREAEEENDCDKAEKVLGRLLTEWYVVGASVSCSCSRYVMIKRTEICFSYWALPA